MYLIRLAFFNAMKFLSGVATKNAVSLAGSLYVSVDDNHYVKVADILSNWLLVFKKTTLSKIFVGAM